MIELNPDTVRFLVDKARQFQTSADLDMSEASDDLEIGDWVEEAAADFAGDDSYRELVAVVEDLEPDQQICLVALMWLGRGDFEIDQWPEALERAREEYNARTASYLATTPLLPDYLTEALTLHGYDDE